MTYFQQLTRDKVENIVKNIWNQDIERVNFKIMNQALNRVMM